MKQTTFYRSLFFVMGILSSIHIMGQHKQSESAGQKAATGNVIEVDTLIALEQGGPHDGGGITTGYSFFSSVQDMDYVFRKRALHPGSAIGYHEQQKDEIYYVVSGEGELTMNGEKSIVGPGTAILTRPGSAHGLKQTGDEDLVIFIIYGK